MKSQLNKFLLLGLLLLLPLAAAETTLGTDKEAYCPGDLVTVAGECSDNVEVGLQAQSGGTNVWFDQVSAAPTYTTTFSPPQEGTYLVFAACQGDQSVNVTIGVSSSACEVEPEPQPDDPGSSSSSSGGGPCISQWDCTKWSLCNKSLKQARDCKDTSRCNRKPLKSQIEKDCDKCQESWTCSLWSRCINGRQSRTCTDDHDCGTLEVMPLLETSCEKDAPGILPSYTPPTQFPPSIEEPAPSFWEKYMWYIIGGISLLLLIIIIIIIVVYVTHKKHHVIYNFNELRDWIKKERAMGTSDEDIKDILENQTGWSEQEVEKAFSQMQSGSSNQQTTPVNKP